jgi:hypothetical protein
MKRNLFRTSMVIITLALMGLTALAVSRPFHLVEHGKLTATPRDASGAILDLVADGIGTATHLGLITVHREATLTATSTASILDIKGKATLTAANGEKLESSFTGTLDTSTGHAELIYDWTGGTGRFQNATGTTFWSVDVSPDGTYDVAATGVINF